MNLTQQQLKAAVEAEIIEQEQADQLYDFLKSQPEAGPKFDFTHVLYYLGGLIAIGAMTLFMTLGWESFGGWGIFFIALAYTGVGLKLSSRFHRDGHSIPAGICAAFVIALTPLAIYGLQQALGFWPHGSVYREYHKYIQWHWVLMELGTLAVGAIMLWRYRYPFMLMPIAVTLWYMSMDVAVMLSDGKYSFELRGLVSIYFGIVMTMLAFWVDFRSRKSLDYAFWLYLFGVMTLWGGITSQSSGSELGKFLYFCFNLILIGAGVIVVRRVFVVFGAIGCCFYLGYLASRVFEDSWLFPIALTAIGLGIIYLGILWQKNESRITARIRVLLPSQLRELLDSRNS